jgi:hypothetical protein
MIDLKSCLGIALALSAASCEGGTSFSSKYAPGFTEEGHTSVSVLGVYHDGRMNPEMWNEIGPPLSAALGERSCEVGFGTALQGEKPDIYTEIDDSTRADGITEEMLAKIAPAAEGEIVLVLSMHGRVDAGKKIEGESAMPTGIAQNGRGSRMRGPASPRMNRTGVSQAELAISATLFSVKKHRSLARLSMIYTGSDLEDAIAKFVARLGTVVPSSTCKGWKWSAPAPSATGG